MNLGPVTKLDKKNKKTSKKFDDDVMSENCGVIVIFPIYGQFRTIQKSDYGRIASKIMKALILKDIFSRTTYVCVLIYKISNF